MIVNPVHLKLSDTLNSGTVIVIEPNENYRATLKRFFANFNVKNLKIFDSLNTAKTEMSINRVSLFVIEWKLTGGQNGLQFCREIRADKRLIESAIMLMSVESLRSDVVLASEIGIDGYMLKPFSFEDFTDQLILLFRKSDERSHYSKLLDQADAAMESGSISDAETLFLECKNYDAQSARTLTGLGRVRLVNGDEDAGISLFKQALTSNNAYLEAYKHLLGIHEKRGDHHHVLHFGLRAHAISPDNPRYMLYIAKAYLSIEDLKNSEIFFRKVIRISPTLAEAHKGLGDIHLLREDYDQAMSCYRKAIDLDGADVSIINSMGLVYIKLQKYQEGIKQYMLALNVDPDNARVLFNLGHAYEKLENYEQAKSYYSRSLIADPEFDKPRRGIGRLNQLIKKASGL